MLIENTLLGERDKVKIAIARIKEFEPQDREYILGFSGGKDSIVCYHLMKMAGVKFKAIYSQTSVDPPELIHYIRKNYKDVIFNKYAVDKNGVTLNMWNLIPKKLLPPTRRVRYCCDILKERTGGPGDHIVLGVRWAESSARSKLPMIGFFKKKVMVRPIIDWSHEEVWEFIKLYNIPYCELYDQGWERIGCIGCPLGKNQKKELEQYPKFKEAYIRAFERMIQNRKEKGKKCKWQTGEEVLKWWLGECIEQNKTLEGQCSMFSD